MHAYFFTNGYLSSLQNGLQSAHVVSEMFIRYVGPDPGNEYFILEKWAREHKTIIILNAGYSSEIQELCTFFKNKANPFPWAYFREEEASLNQALTCVGIILPEEIYNASKSLREGPKGNPSELLSKAIAGDMSGLDPWNGYKPTMWEQELAARLNNYGLAR